jgi:hypothetical protein
VDRERGRFGVAPPTYPCVPVTLLQPLILLVILNRNPLQNPLRRLLPDTKTRRVKPRMDAGQPDPQPNTQTARHELRAGVANTNFHQFWGRSSVVKSSLGDR